MEDIKASDKLSKARAGLILQSPFYASIALRLPLVADPSCQTAWTDGVSLGYNPAFIDGLTIDQCKGLLVHEVLHVANMHHLRRGARELELWNVSTDLAVNPIARSAGYNLPDGLLEDPQFADCSAESIYGVLSNQPGKDQGQEQGQGDDQGDGQGQGQDPASSGNMAPGEVRDLPAGMDKDQAAQDTKVMVQQAAAMAKKMGSLPGDLARMVDQIVNPVLPWREVLQRFLTEHAKDDYTWTRPNKRFLHQGLYLPSLDNPALGDLVLMVDTSCSIDDAALARMVSEFDGILAAYETTLHVVYVDTQVQGSEVITRYDRPDKLSAPGGGGTNFRPGFDWIEEQGIEPAAIVYFTDGECNRFPDPVDKPLLWVLTQEDRDFNPPCGGEVVFMGAEG